MLAWLGPGSIPSGHILLNVAGPGVNSMVCQPDLEDTVISSMTCTGWIKYLVTHSRPDYVFDTYSSSGKLYQIKEVCSLAIYNA